MVGFRPKSSLIFACGLAAIVVLYFGLGALRSDDAYDIDQPNSPEEIARNAKLNDPLMLVSVINSHAKEIEHLLRLNAVTESNREIILKSETSGRVRSLPSVEGEMVSRGSDICLLEEGSRHASVAEAEANLVVRKNELDAAIALEKKQYRSKNYVISARAAHKSAQAALDHAKIERDRVRISAPFSAFLEEYHVEVGDYLSAGQACARLVETHPLRVIAHASPSEVADLKIGQLVGLKFDSGKNISGKLTQIARTAETSTRNFKIEAIVDNSDQSLVSGQTVDMIVRSDPRFLHELPSSALSLDDEGNIGIRHILNVEPLPSRSASDREAIVKKNETGSDEQELVGTAHFSPVRIVSLTTDNVQVAGLPESARVIVLGQEYTQAGRRVRFFLPGADQSDNRKKTQSSSQDVGVKP